MDGLSLRGPEGVADAAVKLAVRSHLHQRDRGCAVHLSAQQRFTAVNRIRRKGHDSVHKLAKDKDGKRVVVTPDDDLLSGGVQALEQLFAKPAAEGGEQGRLF